MLRPLSTKAGALEVSSYGVSEDVRVDVSESGIWILDLGQLAGVLGDVVDLAQGQLSIAFRQKHESNVAIANEMLEVAQGFFINNGYNPGLVSLALDSDSPPLKGNVADIEERHFFTSQPKPEQRLDDASISEGWSCDNDFPNIGEVQRVRR